MTKPAIKIQWRSAVQEKINNKSDMAFRPVAGDFWANKRFLKDRSGFVNTIVNPAKQNPNAIDEYVKSPDMIA